MKLIKFYLALVLVAGSGFTENFKTLENVPKAQQRFFSYEPNHLIPSYKREGDDNGLAGKLSFMYMLSDCEYAVEVKHVSDPTQAPVCNWLSVRGFQPQFFFSYTTEFDFYLGENDLLDRQSKPVIGRMFKPAGHVRLKSAGTKPNGKFIDLTATNALRLPVWNSCLNWVGAISSEMCETSRMLGARSIRTRPDGPEGSCPRRQLGAG